MPFQELTVAQLETFREIGNIGIEHAATALSQMIGEKIELRVPRVTVSEISGIPDLLGGTDRVVAGITLQVLGDVRGSILLIFPRDSAHQLIACLLGQEEKGVVLNEIGTSTLKEVGNILASAYLSALGTVLHLSMIPSVPLLVFDTAGAVIDYVRVHFSPSGSAALMVETEFLGTERRPQAVCGHFFLLPEASSLGRLLQAAAA